jgi:hypothetical protein
VVHALAAVVVWVALVAEVAALVAIAVTVDVASGVAPGAAAVPAHPAMSTARKVGAMSRIAHIITEFERIRGKTSLKA